MNAICDVIYAIDDVIFPLPYCPRCIQCEYQKSEAKVVEKWDFQLLRVDDVMRSLDGAHV